MCHFADSREIRRQGVAAGTRRRGDRGRRGMKGRQQLAQDEGEAAAGLPLSRRRPELTRPQHGEKVWRDPGYSAAELEDA